MPVILFSVKKATEEYVDLRVEHFETVDEMVEVVKKYESEAAAKRAKKKPAKPKKKK